MKLRFNVTDNQISAFLSGDMDTVASEEIKQSVDELLLHSSKKIVIDCSELSYIASNGLRQLIMIYKKTKADGGHLTLKKVSPEVMEVFKVTNFDKVFDFQND